MKRLFILTSILVLVMQGTLRADELFQLFWRGTYYTTNASGHIIAISFSEQNIVSKVARDNGLNPADLVFVYRPRKQDTAVVRKDGAFVADIVHMEYTFTDVENPNRSVTVRHALLFDNSHQDALGSFMGLELRTFNSSGGLTGDRLVGTVIYGKPELPAAFSAHVTTGPRIIDRTNTP
jgi:hypothetical protein